MKGISIPDTVFSVTMPLTSGHGGLHAAATAAPAADKPEHINPVRDNERSNGRPRQQGLVWAFSRAEVITEDQDVANYSTQEGLRGGGLKSGEYDGGGETPAVLSPSAKRRGKGGKHFFAETKSLPTQQVPVEHRLYTKDVEADEGLLGVAKAICECGRRGGGTRSSGGDAGGGGAGSTLKLPLALLKIWGCQSDEERRRNSQTSDADGKVGAPRGGRQLRVVSLWILL